MQKFIPANLGQYAIGRQTDIAIALEGLTGPKSYATQFLSMSTWNVQDAPAPQMVVDARGNRSSNAAAPIGERTHPIEFAGVTDVNKIIKLIYMAFGEVVSVQDGATGAWKHTFTALNNVILPTATIFYSLGAEGYRRLTGVTISQLTVTITDSEASFSGNALAIDEDDIPNSQSPITNLDVEAIEYQADTGLTRYSFGSTVNLSSVKNGDVLDTSAATGITNDENKGKFIIVSANDAGDYVDVINLNRTDDTLDEDTLTSTTTTLYIVVTPTYPEMEAIMLRRHSSVLIADDEAGLSTAEEDGLSKFTFTINNNSMEVREGVRSPNPAIIVSKNISITLTFDQLIKGVRAKLAQQFRDSVVLFKAYRLLLQDNSKYLGTSTSYRPKIQMQVPEGKGIATRANMQGNDEIMYNWNVITINEQNVKMEVQNTVSSTDLLA